MDIRKWLPKVTIKPNAKCFSKDKYQILQHRYDEILVPEYEYYYKWFKHAYGTIEYIDPIDYIELCAKLVHKTSIVGELASCSKQRIAQYAELMAKGELFPLCWIDLQSSSQEGRHRSLAAAALGVKSIPIVIIDSYDYEAQHQDLQFNKNLMFTKDAILRDIKRNTHVTTFYKWPKSKDEAQRMLTHYKD